MFGDRTLWGAQKMRTLAFLMLVSIATDVRAAPEMVSPSDRAKVTALVQAKLKDPESARFRDIRRMDNGGFCGWVNAKNEYGGYVGFTVFYIGGDRATVSILPPDLSEPELCP